MEMKQLVKKINEICEKINVLEDNVKELKRERDNRCYGPKLNSENYPHEFSL